MDAYNTKTPRKKRQLAPLPPVNYANVYGGINLCVAKSASKVST